MRKVVKAFFLIILIASISCEADVDLNEYESQVVVEGIVENNEFPIILLSQNVPIDEKLERVQLSSVPIRWGKVTISDGTNEEVLVGMRNQNRLFQYEYGALHMRGEIGKTYTLKVEYSGRTLTAKTTVPKEAALKTIDVNKLENNDTLYSVKVVIDDNTEEKNYYLFQVKENNGTDVFRPCFVGAIDDKDLVQDSKITIYNSMRIIKGFSLYFSSKKSYVLKVSQIGVNEYAFWKDYFNQILGTANPVYPSSSNLSSNISGGLGIFYGCGSKEYIIDIP